MVKSCFSVYELPIFCVFCFHWTTNLVSLMKITKNSTGCQTITELSKIEFMSLLEMTDILKNATSFLKALQ